MKETKYWTWHIVAGAVILLLLSIHMTVMHLDLILGWFNPAGGRAIEWQNVLSRSRTFIFMITYITLLGAALYHGFYGLRNILFELDLSRGLEKFINICLWVGGVTLFITGTYAAIAVKLL